MPDISASSTAAVVTDRQGYAGLLDILERVIADSHNMQIALILVDLTPVEILVPTIGHRKICGIVDAAQSTIGNIKRPADILTRIDERRFALIIPDLKFPTMADLAANRIVESLDGLRSLTGMNTHIHPVIGIALPSGQEQTAEDLLMAAETAIQAACEVNTSIVHAGGTDSEHITRDKALEAELEAAFMNTQFELHYQPKVNLLTREIYGAEALIRWQHPHHGFISPDIMVPIIERSRLLQEITLWILNTALNQSRLMRARVPDFRVAVNISPQLLDSPELVELVTRALRIWDVEPQHLILEITETSIMVNEDVAQRNLRRLNEAGVLLSIDDFGTGYSSYSYLQRLPVQEMKIDRSFITDLLSDTKNQHLVRSMIQLGRDFNMNVLAEGIETAGIQQRLVDMGCEYGQGYLISRPMPADQVIEWMDNTDWNRSDRTE